MKAKNDYYTFSSELIKFILYSFAQNKETIDIYIIIFCTFSVLLYMKIY